MKSASKAVFLALMFLALPFSAQARSCSFSANDGTHGIDGGDCLTILNPNYQGLLGSVHAKDIASLAKCNALTGQFDDITDNKSDWRNWSCAMQGAVIQGTEFHRRF